MTDVLLHLGRQLIAMEDKEVVLSFECFILTLGRWFFWLGGVYVLVDLYAIVFVVIEM